MKTQNRTNTKLKYFQFLLFDILRKKSLWIVGALYILIFCAFVYLVPLIMHESPFFVWSNPLLSIQTMTAYISCIFASLLVIVIYKNFRDDGTELLVVSKPISRRWILFIKTLVYFLICICYSIIAALFGVFIFCFDVPKTQAASLILCLLLTTLIPLILFGGICLLVSIFANKVWIILSGILLVALSNIYYVIFNYANIVESPSDEYLKNNDTSITTFNYLNSDGESYDQYAYIVNQQSATEWINKLIPTDIDHPEEWFKDPLYKIYDLQDDFKQKTDESLMQYVNWFNADTLLHQMGNAFALEDNTLQNANKAFGWDCTMNYRIKDSFLVDKFSARNGLSFPILFLDYNNMPYISEAECNPTTDQDYLNILKWMLPSSIPGGKNGLMSIQNQELYTVGSDTSQISSSMKIMLAQATMANYAATVNYPDSRGRQHYGTDFLETTKQEDDFFNALLNSENKIFLKKYTFEDAMYSFPEGLIHCQTNHENDGTILPFTNVSSDNSKFINNSSSLNYQSPAFELTIEGNSNLKPVRRFADFNEYIHFCLLCELKSDKTDGNWVSLNIHSNEQLMIEALKFKYYILMNQYVPLQKQYVNQRYMDFANDHDYLYNANGFGCVFLPMEISNFNPSSLSFNCGPSQIFFNPEYVAVSTLVKNFVFHAEKNGYAGTKTYTGTDGKEYLEPGDYTMRKGGNTGYIATNSDSIITTDFFGFSFESSPQISSQLIFIISTFISLLIYGVGYVIYSRIDFK